MTGVLRQCLDLQVSEGLFQRRMKWVPTRGLEPPTLALRVRCSAIELRRLGDVSIAHSQFSCCDLRQR